jgi:mono/diheme cytochrome c family protein
LHDTNATVSDEGIGMEIRMTAGFGHADASHRLEARHRANVAHLAVALVLAGAWVVIPLRGANADSQLARGKYLVSINGCTDCHTPGHFLGKEDATKYLGGSDVGFAIPGLGVFVGANLTPDKTTGLGNWTPAQIVTALTTGKTPEGRMLAPSMPWREYSNLTASDAQAIAAFLKSLPPVQHQVPGPFGPTQTPSVFVMSVQPGDVYAGLPKRGGPPPAPPASPPPAPDAK